MKQSRQKRQGCWVRSVETEQGPVEYRAHATDDPKTIAALDELVQAVIRQAAPCPECDDGQPSHGPASCQCACHQWRKPLKGEKGGK